MDVSRLGPMRQAALRIRRPGPMRQTIYVATPNSVATGADVGGPTHSPVPERTLIAPIWCVYGAVMTDDADPPAPKKQPPNLEEADRFTVRLIPQAHAHMCDLRTWLRMSKVDIVNRAVTLYHMYEQETRGGNRLAVLKPDGTIEAIRVL